MRGLIVHRSVQLVARNREARTEVESFVHQNARYEGIIESRTVVESFVHRDARYGGIGKSRIEVDSFVHRSVQLVARNK